MYMNIYLWKPQEYQAIVLWSSTLFSKTVKISDICREGAE